MTTTTPSSARLQLGTKITPAQQRAVDTYERILAVTAQILEEEGFERLSTNMVCAHAGLTPPALYRYFPNKYAILVELATRLMDRQDILIPRWITLEVLQAGPQAVHHALAGLLHETYVVTRETVAGIWIMRAIRAIPLLQEVRLRSHTKVTTMQAVLLGQALPHVPNEELMLVCRVVANLLHAAVEMLLEEPCEPHAVADIVGGMMAGHMSRLMARA